MDEEKPALGVDRGDLPSLLRLRRWRHRDWLLFWLPIVPALVLAYLHFTSPPPAISLSAYERITRGMSERQVERIIRARPGGYEWFWGSHASEFLEEKHGEPAWSAGWGNRYGVLEVGYTADGRVCSKRLVHNPWAVPEEPDRWSWWRRLLNRSLPAEGTQCGFISF